MALIPTRSSHINLNTFIQVNLNLEGYTREQNILQEFSQGNIPDFLRKFIPIDIKLGSDVLSILVMPDYLSIGTDDNYLRIPMLPQTAQKIANLYDCSLPTKKMVDVIWTNAANKLAPKRIPPDKKMNTTLKFVQHNEQIQNQLSNRDFTKLTAGHKKDIVITKRLEPNNPRKKIAIYGWHKINGIPIQDLNTSSHSIAYCDYSHGVRLIANDVLLNGKYHKIQDILNSNNYRFLSDEGSINFKY